MNAAAVFLRQRFQIDGDAQLGPLASAVERRAVRPRRRGRQDADARAQPLVRREAGAVRRRPRYRGAPGDRADRPVRLRQVDLPALPQPHERRDRGLPRSTGEIRLDGEDIYDRSDRRRAAARQGRHGLPEAEPVPQVDLRERRLRPAHPRPRREQDRAGRDRSRRACSGAGLLEEVKDRLDAPGQQPLRRPAAAPVHRARDRGQPRGHSDGRALLGARSDRDRAHRGADRRAARALHDRDRHPQHAAGGARLAEHRVLPPRQVDRVRRHRPHLHQPEGSR